MTYITLAHGNGGCYMRGLIEDVFTAHLANGLLDSNKAGVQIVCGDTKVVPRAVTGLCRALYDLSGLHFMRDPTRGGLATVMHEILRATGLGIRLQQSSIPVRETVTSVCEILGYDPLYLACEGRVVAIVAKAQAEQALQCWRALPAGVHSALIGYIDDSVSQIVLETELGGERLLEELADDPLPRIC